MTKCCYWDDVTSTCTFTDLAAMFVFGKAVVARLHVTLGYRAYVFCKQDAWRHKAVNIKVFLNVSLKSMRWSIKRKRCDAITSWTSCSWQRASCIFVVDVYRQTALIRSQNTHVRLTTRYQRRTCSALARVASLVVMHEAVFTREHAHGAAGARVSRCCLSCNHSTTSTHIHKNARIITI